MIYNGVLLRKEIKYFLNFNEYTSLVKIIKGIAKHDVNVREDGRYSVSSLYFDDIYNSAYILKKIGMPKTYKFRIRCYNNQINNIKLEKKFKFGDYGGKDSEHISEDEYRSIISGIPISINNSSSNLLKAFYVDTFTRLLKPEILVVYEREAFIWKIGSESLRITLDSKLQWSLDSLDVFNTKAVYLNADSEDKYILEIKYHNNLPEIISDFLILLNRFADGPSKYRLCRRQKENLNWRGCNG